jgi:hypothetical protein
MRDKNELGDSPSKLAALPAPKRHDEAPLAHARVFNTSLNNFKRMDTGHGHT